MQPVEKRLDIAIALVLIAICAVFLWESSDLPPGTFEPLGSAPVPQATALVIVLLCLVVIVQATLRPASEPGAGDERYVDAAVLVILTVVYVALIHLRVATFAVLTSIYLVVTIGWLVRFERRLLPAVGITALAVGFGCQYIFTRIFVVDLPGL